MKQFLFLLSIALLSCHSEDTGTPAPKSQGNPSAPKRAVQLNTGTKSLFKIIEKLPPGIESVFNKMPSKEEGFYKFTFPRSDLSVSIDGVKIDPGFLSTWFAFRPMDTVNAMALLMGEVVLLESEVRSVLQKLDQRGIDVSSINSFLLKDQPKLTLLHVTAMGDPIDLSAKMKEVLQLTSTSLKVTSPDTLKRVDWGKTEKNLGVIGKKEGNLLRFSIPRNERIKEEGIELPESFGVSSVINFQKAGAKAAISGEIVLLPTEISTTEKILSRAGILVTAINSQMLFDEPHFFILHFWTVDDPEKVALTLHDLLGNSNHKL